MFASMKKRVSVLIYNSNAGVGVFKDWSWYWYCFWKIVRRYDLVYIYLRYVTYLFWKLMYYFLNSTLFNSITYTLANTFVIKIGWLVHLWVHFIDTSKWGSYFERDYKRQPLLSFNPAANASRTIRLLDQTNIDKTHSYFPYSMYPVCHGRSLRRRLTLNTNLTRVCF